jgi:O-antigen/teichoic acid export membrane protein
VNPLFTSLGMAAAHSAQAFRVQFEGHAKWMLGLAFTAAVAAMLIAPSVIQLLYGEAYLSSPISAIGPFRWLALGGVFAWVTPVFVVAETTRGNARALMLLGLACLGLTVLGNAWAIPRHGANGAAAVLCLCEAFVFGVLLVRFAARRDLRLNAAWAAYLVPGLVLGAALFLSDGFPVLQWVLAGVGIPAALYLLLQLPAQRARRASASLLSAKWSPTSSPPIPAHQQPSR